MLSKLTENKQDIVTNISTIFLYNTLTIYNMANILFETYMLGIWTKEAHNICSQSLMMSSLMNQQIIHFDFDYFTEAIIIWLFFFGVKSIRL